VIHSSSVYKGINYDRGSIFGGSREVSPRPRRLWSPPIL
jgi:hypothetical protein